jgi:[ribosomal protein S5]-alanine N-acetyltransferase
MRLPLQPYPELHSARLRLRRPAISDAPDLFALRSRHDVMKLVRRPLHQQISESEELLQRLLDDIQHQQGLSWVICLPDNPTLIGTIGFWQLDMANHHAETGYLLHPDYWGQGLITEALAAVEDTGFRRMGLHRLQAVVFPDHAASIRVLEKRGFQQEGCLRENIFFENQYYDLLIYGKLAPGLKTT